MYLMSLMMALCYPVLFVTVVVIFGFRIFKAPLCRARVSYSYVLVWYPWLLSLFFWSLRRLD